MSGREGSGRDEVLRRIRRNLVGTGAVDGRTSAETTGLRPDVAEVPASGGVAATYRVAGSLDAQARIERFIERVQEYGVRVRRSSRASLPETLAECLAARNAANAVIALDAPSAWRVPGVAWLEDGATELVSVAALDAVDAVVTGCGVAIADTGTVVLDGGVAQGRRVLTLVPDYHLCVVMAEQVVETVPEAVRWLEPAVREGRPITLVSGPSATSDIELNRVEGVHGPRTLEVILVGWAPLSAA